MTLKPEDLANFYTMLRAAENGDLALMESADRATGEYRAVICAVMKEGGDFRMVPFGHLCNGDPYAEYVPPIAGAPVGKA
jgi:hypothetical protein